mmetsp:Transcript_94901/g.164752  ORF Transcript_94901/g.164752 Transcript_94901/m.164752 type:complete len:347 (-) Transcript_94901:74-1114(-)
MRTLVLALACLACACHGRRVKVGDAAPSSQPSADGSLVALQALSKLLVTSKAAATAKEAVSPSSTAGFNPSASAARSATRPAPRRRAQAPMGVEQKQRDIDGPFKVPDLFASEQVPEDYRPGDAVARIKSTPVLKEAATEVGWWAFVWNLYWGTNFFFSFPVSYVTFYNLPQEFPNFFVAANLGTLPFMFMLIFWIKTNWDTVSSSLLDRKIYYEGEGLGGLFKGKQKEERYRDRMVAKDVIRPARARIDKTLNNIIIAFIGTWIAGQGVLIFQGDNGPYTLKSLIGESAVEFNERLKWDDDRAAEEQRRALTRRGMNGKMQPVYCNSRYYKILAGNDAQGGGGCL